MTRPPYLAPCLLMLLTVVVSGCGSSETASTGHTASVVASAPATTPQTASTSSTATPPTTTTVVARKAAVVKPNAKPGTVKVKPKSEAKGATQHAEAPAPGNTAVPKVPPSELYTSYEHRTFVASCAKLKGLTSSSCECLLARFELKGGEKLESAAELTVTEVYIQAGRKLPRRFRRLVAECNA